MNEAFAIMTKILLLLSNMLFALCFLECPYSTYKDYIGYAKSCTPCPVNSRHSKIGSTKRSDCHCIQGYEGDPAGYVECKSKYRACCCLRSKSLVSYRVAALDKSDGKWKLS